MSLKVFLNVAEPRPAEPHKTILVRRGDANIEVTRSEWDSLNPTGCR